MGNEENLGKCQPRLAGIIIVTQPHIIHLEAVLEDLENQSEPFSEIIVVASGLDEAGENAVSAFVKAVQAVPVKTEFVSLGSAGKNRNAAIKAVSEDIDLMLFHDADDRYSRHRNSSIVREYAKQTFDALVHLYVPTNETDSKRAISDLNQARGANEPMRIMSAEIYGATFPGGERDRRGESLGVVNSSLSFPEPYEDLPVHHAHACIRKASLGDLRFHESFFPRNEDSLLLRDMLFRGLNVVALCSPLSIWVQGTSSVAANSKSRIRLLHFKQRVHRAKKLFEIFKTNQRKLEN